MANSRAKLRADDKPTNTNKGHGLILETPYKPGFVDDLDLETIKMAVDKELSQISNAFYQTTERTADTIKRIDEIKIEGDGLLAKIEEVDRVSKEGDKALAERITTLTATVDGNTALITEESRARADADQALSETIDTVKAETEAGIAEVKQTTSALSDKTGKLEAKWGVTVDVNGNVAGVELNNGTGGSEFKVLANRFYFTDGTTPIPPFAVVGNTVHMSNVVIRGTLYAEDILGDLASEQVYYSKALLYPAPNTWHPWTSINILHSMPYARSLFLEGPMIIDEKADGFTHSTTIEAMTPGGGYLGRMVWTSSGNGMTTPARIGFDIPANFSGQINFNFLTDGPQMGLFAGLTSIRMFKASKEFEVVY